VSRKEYEEYEQLQFNSLLSFLGFQHFSQKQKAVSTDSWFWCVRDKRGIFAEVKVHCIVVVAVGETFLEMIKFQKPCDREH